MSSEPDKSYDVSSSEIFKTPIAPKTSISHVHLKVADIQRSFAIDCGMMCFISLVRYGSAAA